MGTVFRYEDEKFPRAPLDKDNKFFSSDSNCLYWGHLITRVLLLITVLSIYFGKGSQKLPDLSFCKLPLIFIDRRIYRIRFDLIDIAVQ